MMPQPNGFRITRANAPTRRQLAVKLAEAIPIVNAHSKDMEGLTAFADSLAARLQKVELALASLEAERERSFLERLRGRFQ